MGQGNFAGARNCAAADEGLGCGGVVGGADGTLIHQGDAIGQ
jgi:hypothetical protein